MIIKRRYNVMLKPRSMDILESQSRDLEISRSALIDRIIDEWIIENGLFLDPSDMDIIEGQKTFEEVIEL